LYEEYTDSGHQAARTTKFCTVVTNIFGVMSMEILAPAV